tara:strand:- start:496 stop:1545 length:1050 start_codon:yes stop_codon:yes gene_type:complete
MLADKPDEHMSHDHSHMDHNHEMMENQSMHHEVSSIPLSIMEAGTHKAGHFMFSLRHMRMSMDDNSDKGNKLSDQEIISYPSLNSMTPFLSAVPKKMDMEMTMLEAMYGISDNHIFMLMANFVNKEMSLNSYSPMGNRDFLRVTNTSSSDLSNLSMSSFFKFKESQNFRMNAEIGIDKSLGKNNIKKNVITPMNMTMNMTLPYAMQAGDKSTSLLTAFTIVSKGYDLNFGGQIKRKSAVLKKDWNFGDSLMFNFWLSKLITPKSSLSLNFKYQKIDKIEGRDLSINAPTQTANPQYYGGKSTSLSTGLNIQLNHKNSLGFEYSVPLKQDLNGPQMEVKNSFNFVYETSF